MKHLIFLSARIRQYYQSSRAIFCIFIIGSVLLNILILYMYGNTVTYMRSKKLNTPLYCKYTVNLSEAGFAELLRRAGGTLNGISDQGPHLSFGLGNGGRLRSSGRLPK